MLRTPLTLTKHFSASSEGGLVSTFRKADSASGEGMENMVAVKVAGFRGQGTQDAQTCALADLMRGVWSGAFGDEVMELCQQDMATTGNATTAFLWRRYLKETSKHMGVAILAQAPFWLKGFGSAPLHRTYRIG